MIAVNTCFRHGEKEKYTWISPDGHTKNMIEYIIVRRRERVGVKDSRSHVSADCDSDHQMVWMKMRGKAWKSQRQKKRMRKRDLTVLGRSMTKRTFEETLKRKVGDHLTWTSLHQGLVESIEEVCPEKPPVSKPWIDEECWRLIQERAGARQREMNSDEHREATKKAKKALCKSKRKWYADILKETNEAQAQGDYKTVYKNIKKVNGKKISKPGIGIKDADVTMIYDKKDIMKRWKDYCAELFGREEHVQEEIERGEEEPLVLKPRLKPLSRRQRKEKAVGIDEVPAEALKAGGETIIKAMKNIIDEIWRTGEWPELWVMSELVPLPKVPGTQDCTKYRTAGTLFGSTNRRRAIWLHSRKRDNRGNPSVEEHHTEDSKETRG
ncbi:uncharacterized protein LOC119576766 [Penaeus monodon]|uniref:uncharacterized protein LOC119576766 n=1 Tax=Penaeus monodon TaxID=6687 RepID=UPI0018A7791D|nr:uncharacterized protein LOC119576766 [Penaeus monodon]